MAVVLDQNALTTLERVRADLGISVTTYDDKILRAINSASGLIERYCGRKFWRDTAVEEKVPGYGTVQMRLARRPLNSITEILFEADTVDSDSYSISNERAGFVEKKGGWNWTAHTAGDISRGVLPGTELHLYTVTYDGGWYTPEQSRARGTITFTDQPTAEDDLVINETTITAKAIGTATGDEFDIGASVRATCNNLVTAINAGTESTNVRAWRVNLTVVVEWLEEGDDGNTVPFTESMDNVTMDGTNVLGGTQTGVTRGLPWDLEDAAIEFSRNLYLAKNKDPGVSSEKLLSWSASYGGASGSGGGSAAGIPPSISRVLDQYKVLV